ncbi:MAG: putative transcriptional regulator [Parcubacteria bacterium C7867-007]|nr:MAG: putative transcriptional regulator [Parcubacteria bacterium C7867-007]
MQEVVHNKVSEYRTAANITQEELAVAIGVSRQTVIAIEKGNYAPSVLLALKIARYFKKPLETIFTLRHA